MSVELLKAIQSVVQTNVGAMKLSDYVLGTVISVNPLKIQISPKDIIPEELLILTDGVRDFDVDIEVNHTTKNRGGGSGVAEFQSHNHGYKGRKKIRVYNGLHVGEQVIMLQQTGGQEFCVLSRVFNHTNLSGQWG